MGVEQRVRTWRRLLRLVGFPTHEDAWRLAEILYPHVKVVKTSDCDVPHVYRFTGARALILIPERWEEAWQVRFLIHELGHVEVGERHPCEMTGGPTPEQQRRLYRLNDGQDERRVSEVVLAWLLPWDTVDLSMDPEEIADESGCSLEEVYARLAMVVR